MADYDEVFVSNQHSDLIDHGLALILWAKKNTRALNWATAQGQNGQFTTQLTISNGGKKEYVIEAVGNTTNESRKHTEEAAHSMIIDPHRVDMGR